MLDRPLVLATLLPFRPYHSHGYSTLGKLDFFNSIVLFGIYPTLLLSTDC